MQTDKKIDSNRFFFFLFFFTLYTLHFTLYTAIMHAGLFVVDGAGGAYNSIGATSTWTQTNTNISYPILLTWKDVCRDALGNLYALATTGEVYRSRDNGVTWEPRGDIGPLTTYDSITADTTTAGVLYVLNSAISGPTDNAVFRSTDGALTWPGAKSGLIRDTYVGIAVYMGRVYVIDDDGETNWTSLDLLAGWVTKTDVGSATDYTHLFRDMRGYLYVLRAWGTPVSRSVDGGTTWVELIYNPSTDAKRLYSQLTQNRDRTDIYPGNLYILRSDGTGVYSLDDGATAWKTDWVDIGARTDYYGLCSCDMIPPGFTDLQPGDTTWYSINVASYNVDFYDTNYGKLRKFETRVTNAPGGVGFEIDPWTTVADEINTSSYTVNWKLKDETWTNLKESVTNYVYVRVTDNAYNVTTSTYDVFYVRKDTTSPTVPVLISPINGAATNYLTISFDWSDSSDTASGVSGYEFYISTASDFSIFTSSFVTTSSLTRSLIESLYYWKVRAKDKANNYSVYSSTWVVTIDTTAPTALPTFTAEAGDQRVTLSWTNVGGDQIGTRICSSTTLEVLVSPTNYYLIDISTPINSYVHTGLTNDVTYYYKAFAYDRAFNYSPPKSSSAVPMAIADTLYVSHYPKPSANVLQGSATNIADVLRFTVSANTVAITGITIREIGTSEDSDISAIRLIDDLDLSSTTTAGDTLLSSGTFSNGIKTLSLNYNVTFGTTKQILIAFDVSTTAVHGRSVITLLNNENDITVAIPDRVQSFTNYISSTYYIVDVTSPSNVTAFTAMPDLLGNKITLSWVNPLDVDFRGTRICASTITSPTIYETYLSTDLVKPTTYYIHANLTDGVTYYYRAFAYDAIPNYASGISTSTYPRDKTAPAGVTNLSAQPGTLQKAINLTWTAPGDNGWSGNLTGKFRIKHSTTSTYSWQNPPLTDYNIEISTNNQLPITNYQYTVTGLSEGATYYFRLWTADEAGNYSAISNGATTYSTRESPANVTYFTAVSSPTGNRIDLSWVASTSTDYTGTRICASTVSFAAIIDYTVGVVTTTLKPTTYYLHTGLTDNVTYYYKAFSYDDAITPNYATGVSTSTYPRDIVAPGDVINFTASGGDKYVNLSWINVYGDQKGTRICYSSTTPNFSKNEGILISSDVPVNSYTHSNLENNVTYYYRAFAYDEVPNYSPGVISSATPTAIADTLSVEHYPKPSANVLQGSTTNTADVLHFTVNRNTVTITGITIREISTSEDSDVSKVRLINDVDLSSSVTAGDILLSTANFVSGIATFSLNYDVSTTTARQILIAFDVSTTAVHSRTVVTRLAAADVSVAPPDVVASFGPYESNSFSIVDVTSPSNVSNFTAIAISSGNQIDLSWENPPDIDYQAVVIRYRNDSYPTSATDGLYVATVPAPGASYSHTGLTNGTTYYYTAFGRDAVPNYASGVSISTSPRDTLPPANVTLSSVSVADNQITLNWINPLTADTSGVLILRSSSPVTDAPSNGATYTVGSIISVSSVVYNSNSNPNDSISWTNTGLVNNTTYYYKLFARDEVPNYATGVSTSAYPRDTVAPNPVTNLTAQPGSAEKTILLSWSYTGDNGNVGDFTTGYYRIQLATYSAYPWDRVTAVEYSTANVLSGASGCHIVTGTATGLPLLEGGTYYFRMWLTDEAKNWSGMSNSTFSWATRVAPGNVTDFTAYPLSEGNKINLSWSTGTVSADFQGVRICSSTVSFATITDYTVGIVTTTLKPTTYYLHTNLADNVTYYYKAFSYDNAITPNYAIGISTSTYPRDTIAPAAVTNLVAELIWGTSIQLKWTAPGDNGATGDIVNGSYWIKYSSSVSTIDGTNWGGILTEMQWSTNTAPGNWEVKITTGLQSDTTYYFALKTRDEVPGQWSYVSNCATGTTLDITAPAGITNLSGKSGDNPGEVVLNWDAPGDDDGVGQANIYDIRYTNVLPFFWDTANTWKSNRPVGGYSGFKETETVAGLTPGATYYFRIKTADERPNWSGLSNLATGYATPAPPAGLTLYFSSSSVSSPFTITTSDKLSTSSGTISNTDAFAQSDKDGINYFQFYPRATNPIAETTLPSGITQRGWIYQVPLTYKTLSAGLWNINLGWRCTTTAGRGKFNYRISKVSATVTGTIELREKLLDWRQDEDELIPAVADVTYYRNFWTPTVSLTTFLPGEYLMVELYINVTVKVGTPEHGGWRLEVSTGSNYVVTPEIKDIIPPADINNLYTVPASTEGIVIATWTAPGNNALLGQATYYDIRYTEDPNFDWDKAWTAAPGSTRPVSGPVGKLEREEIKELTPGTTYYLRIKTYDDAGNKSGLSNLGRARVPVHPIKVVNVTPQHGRMNEGKRDALLRFSITNDRPSGPGYYDIGLSQLKVKFTKDGSTALTNPQAKELFSNIYLYLATAPTGYYHYDVDLSTLAIITNAEISLDGEGVQIIKTSTVPWRAISPGTKREYYLVADLTTFASTQTVNTFSVTVPGLDKITCRDEVTKSTVPSKAETSFPITSSPKITIIKPPTPPTGWPKRIGPLRSVNSRPTGGADTNNVYIGADDGNFYAFSSTGGIKWEYPTGNKIRSSIQANTEQAENYVYFYSEDGNIYKLRDEIGGYTPMWNLGSATLGATPLGDASVVVYVVLSPFSSNLYICANNRKVYKVNGTYGTKVTDGLWASPPELDGPLSPFIIVDQFTGGVDSLWVGTDKSLYRISTGNGEVLNQLNLGSRFRNDPGLDSGWIVKPNLNYLFAPCDNGKIYCRQSTNLGIVPADWQAINGEFNAGSPITTMVALWSEETGKYLYFGTENGKVYKIKAEDGTLVWTYQAGGKISSTPLLDGDYIYFGCEDGYFYAIHKDTKEMRDDFPNKFPIRTGAEISESPIYMSGKIYILSADGIMYCVNP